MDRTKLFKSVRAKTQKLALIKSLALPTKWYEDDLKKAKRKLNQYDLEHNKIEVQLIKRGHTYELPTPPQGYKYGSYQYVDNNNNYDIFIPIEQIEASIKTRYFDLQTLNKRLFNVSLNDASIIINPTITFYRKKERSFANQLPNTSESTTNINCVAKILKNYIEEDHYEKIKYYPYINDAQFKRLLLYVKNQYNLEIYDVQGNVWLSTKRKGKKLIKFTVHANHIFPYGSTKTIHIDNVEKISNYSLLINVNGRFSKAYNYEGDNVTLMLEKHKYFVDDDHYNEITQKDPGWNLALINIFMAEATKNLPIDTVYSSNLNFTYANRFNQNFVANETVIPIDSNSHFASYKEHCYYKSYQMPLPPVMFKNHPTNDILEKNGFARIQSVKYNNEFVRNLVIIGSDQCTFFLKYLLDTRQISDLVLASATWSDGSHDPKIHDNEEARKSVKWDRMTKKHQKEMYCMIFGCLKINKKQKHTTVQVNTTKIDKLERMHLMTLNNYITATQGDKDLVFMEKSEILDLPTYAYLWMPIIAYATMKFLDFYRTIPKQLISYTYADCIYLKSLQYKIKLPSQYVEWYGPQDQIKTIEIPEGWKMEDPKVAKPATQSTHITRPTQPHEDNTEPLIQLYIGYAGTGKSYECLKTAKAGTLVTAGTKKLLANHKSNFPNLTYQTAHQAFSHKTHRSNEKQTSSYHTIIIDECGLISSGLTDAIMTYVKSHPHQRFKFIYGLNQIAAIDTADKDYSLKMIKSLNPIIHNFTTIKRTEDQELIKRINAIHANNTLYNALQVMQDRIVEDVVIHKEDVVLVSKHKFKEYFTTADTFHSQQGLTLKDNQNIYIVVKDLFDPYMLNMAINRATRLDQIYLILDENVNIIQPDEPEEEEDIQFEEINLSMDYALGMI